MKKSLIILLGVFYLAVASGLSVNYHFCGNKLKKVSFFSVSDETGCCGSKKKSKNCCDDKLTFFKIKSEQVSGSDAKMNTAQFISDFTFPDFVSLVNNNQKVNISIPEIYPPPEKVSQKLFIQFRTLLI